MSIAGGRWRDELSTRSIDVRIPATIDDPLFALAVIWCAARHDADVREGRAVLFVPRVEEGVV